MSLVNHSGLAQLKSHLDHGPPCGVCRCPERVPLTQRLGGPGAFHAGAPRSQGPQHERHQQALGLCVLLTQTEDLAGDRQACSHFLGWGPLLEESGLCHLLWHRKKVGWVWAHIRRNWPFALLLPPPPHGDESVDSCSKSYRE